MRKVSVIASLLVIAVVVVGIALSKPHKRTVNVSSAPTNSNSQCLSIPGTGSSTTEFAIRSLNEVVSASDAAVVARVTGIEAPRWNPGNGGKWCNQGTGASGLSSGPAPRLEYQYQMVNMQVTDVLFSTPKLPLNPGSTVSVHYPVGGQGQHFDLPDGSQIALDEFNGPEAVGSTEVFSTR